MTRIELAVEHALISAGCWWPGSRAEIIVAMGDDCAHETDKPAAPFFPSTSITKLVEQHRAAYPERFLALEQPPDRDIPADRYAATIKAIYKFRLAIFRDLQWLRTTEPSLDSTDPSEDPEETDE